MWSTSISTFGWLVTDVLQPYFDTVGSVIKAETRLPMTRAAGSRVRAGSRPATRCTTQAIPGSASGRHPRSARTAMGPLTNWPDSLHLRFQHREVVAAPYAQGRRDDRRQFRRRGDQPGGAQVGAVPVQAARQVAGRLSRSTALSASGWRVPGAEVRKVVGRQPLLGHALELEQQHSTNSSPAGRSPPGETPSDGRR